MQDGFAHLTELGGAAGDFTAEMWISNSGWSNITIIRDNDVIKQYVNGIEQPNMQSYPKKSKSKHKFSRAKWYDANFDPARYFEIKEWCTQQFGPLNTNPDAWTRWFMQSHGVMRFRDEKDAMMFILRWS